MFSHGAGVSEQVSQLRVQMTEQMQELQDTFDAKLTLSTFSRKNRPRRSLSYVSKSAAWKLLQNSQDFLVEGIEFPFPLLVTSVKSTAFSVAGPESKEDENKDHHPYFLHELAKLVSSAKAQDLKFEQQVYWTKDGHWLSLDDGTPGVEPDFCTAAFESTARNVVPDPDRTSHPSKYAVTVAFEQKKAFSPVDQMEAVDYGERLLCIQRGRRVAYAALFHCCGSSKYIRWIRVTETDETVERFKVAVTRPAALGPAAALDSLVHDLTAAWTRFSLCAAA
jgi:hypothetical protein